MGLSRIVQRGDAASPRKITNAFVPDHALAVVPSGDPRFPRKVVSVVPEMPNDKGISMLEVVFGQFINHDQEFNLETITVSNPEGDKERARRESIRIPIPEDDLYRTDPSLTQGNTWRFQIINPSLGEEFHITEASPFGPRHASFVEQGDPGSMGAGDCLRNLERNSFFVVDFAWDYRL